MLIGEYSHTLDDKKRLSLPAKFRKEVGKKIIIMRGLDSCLFIFSEKAWAGIAKKLSGLPMSQEDIRGFSRFLLSGAVEEEVDSAGRILIPDHLKEFANLGAKVVLAGVLERIEVWNEDAWQTYKQKIEKDADKMASRLGDIGIL